jgi:tetratricopeptide (TPR) repeat protein
MVPYGLMAVAYLALRFSVLGRISWKHPFMVQVPDSAIWMTVPFVVVTYLRHLIAPFYLSLIYGTSFINDAGDLRFLLPTAILIALAALLWIYRRSVSRQIWIATALIVAPLLPVLNLRVFHFEYIIQDRYLYLPSIGFCCLLALLIVRLARRQKQLAVGLALLLVIIFGAGTVAQNRVWHDAVALWQRAIYYAPNSWSTHYNLGLAYLNRKEYQAALNELMVARRLNSAEPSVLNNLALAQNASGLKLEAIATLKEALQIAPELVEAHNNLGTILFEHKMFDEAWHEFNEVLTRDPSSMSARFNLARTLVEKREYEPANRQFEAVLASDANDLAARYELAASYAASGHKPQALAEFNRALQMDRDPKRPDEMRKRLAPLLQAT